MSGLRVRERPLGGARDLLADDDAHAAADEAVLHRGDHDRQAVERAGADDDGVLQAGGLDAGLEPVPVRLGVGELERVDRPQAGVVLGPGAAVEQHLQPIGGRHAEVVVALRADLEDVDQILVVDAPGCTTDT